MSTVTVVETSTEVEEASGQSSDRQTLDEQQAHYTGPLSIRYVRYRKFDIFDSMRSIRYRVAPPSTAWGAAVNYLTPYLQ